MVITVLENSNMALKTLCNENESILLPQIRTENCVYCWRDIPRACVYVRVCVCVCVRACVYMDITWRSKGGVQMAFQYFFY